MLNKKINYNFIYFLIIVIITFTAGLLMTTGDKIQPNIYINGIDVGKLTKEEALEKVKYILDSSLSELYTTLKIDEKTWKLKYSDINYKYEYKDSIEDAYDIGRGKNIFLNVKDALYARINKVNIILPFSYEANYINSLLSKIAKEVNQEALDATLKMVNKKFVITDEETGKELDQQKSYDLIIENIEKAQINLIELPLIKTEPEIKRADLEIIQDKLGEFTTSFNASDTGRSYNILLATKSVTNVLVRPGATFSMNKTIGPRLEKYGFKTAKVIINSELVEGIGGGVCQVSTTLYNAVLLSNLKIVERRNHSLPSAYIGLGRDATISDNDIDFKFQNTTKYPIYIYGELKGGTVTFSVYGKNDNPNTKVKIVTEVIKKTTPQMIIIKDPTLKEGTEIVEKKARIGYIVKSYREVYENGKEIRKELLDTDTYKEASGVKRVGTMKPIELDILPEVEPVY